MELRDYQKEITIKGVEVLNKHKFLYLAMEVRTGKTLTSLSISNLLPVQNLLFITKKKAISSIQDDYNSLSPSYDATIINYESLHKIEEQKWDMIICDEAHGMGAFPKPSLRAKLVRSLLLINNPYVILLSGTPTPESYSQMYHQVYGIPNNPFKHHKSFYKFAHEYIQITQKKIGAFNINDYSNGSDSIIEEMKPYTIAYTQKEAGFKVETNEEILYVDICNQAKDIIRNLKRDLVVEGRDETILADTGVKLMSKTHQLYSGTVKFESGNSMVICNNKAEYIRDKFKGQKIAIFYKFKEELNAIKQVFEDTICTELEDFNSTDKSIALQIVSGREGISLKLAEALVYYNIDFSATSYWQSRDRMTTKDRKFNKIYWIFAIGGIEKEIYKSVIKKKDYTLNHFKKDLLNL
tara:strand:+ start:450 stop:1679 length:1230 start_codon:yes stop_codon:yes gene_type:complete